jgi:hypothetical protein
MDLKAVKFDPEQGLTYLARVFIDPYTTDTTIQDPVRTLRKLHLTARNATVPLPDAALDRVEGFEITDGLSPIVSDYVQAVKKWYTPLASNKAIRDKRADKYVDKPYWLFEDGATKSWPQRNQDSELMLTIFLNRTGISMEIYQKLRDHINDVACMQPSSLLTLNLDLELTSTYVGTVLPDANTGGLVKTNAQSLPPSDNNNVNNLEPGPSPKFPDQSTSGFNSKPKGSAQQYRRNDGNAKTSGRGHPSSAHHKGFNRTKGPGGPRGRGGQERQNNSKRTVLSPGKANNTGLDGRPLPVASNSSRAKTCANSSPEHQAQTSSQCNSQVTFQQ